MSLCCDFIWKVKRKKKSVFKINNEISISKDLTDLKYNTKNFIVSLFLK